MSAGSKQKVLWTTCVVVGEAWLFPAGSVPEPAGRLRRGGGPPPHCKQVCTDRAKNYSGIAGPSKGCAQGQPAFRPMGWLARQVTAGRFSSLS